MVAFLLSEETTLHNEKRRIKKMAKVFDRYRQKYGSNSVMIMFMDMALVFTMGVAIFK